MTDQETFALLIFLGWLAMMVITITLTELDRYRRGKETFNWVKRLYERLYTRTDK